jgi:hypothetical protein
MVRREG